MADEFMEISKGDIESVENALKVNADYIVLYQKFITNNLQKLVYENCKN